MAKQIYIPKIINNPDGTTTTEWYTYDVSGNMVPTTPPDNQDINYNNFPLIQNYEVDGNCYQRVVNICPECEENSDPVCYNVLGEVVDCHNLCSDCNGSNTYTFTTIDNYDFASILNSIIVDGNPITVTGDLLLSDEGAMLDFLNANIVACNINYSFVNGDSFILSIEGTDQVIGNITADNTVIETPVSSEYIEENCVKFKDCSGNCSQPTNKTACYGGLSSGEDVITVKTVHPDTDVDLMYRAFTTDNSIWVTIEGKCVVESLCEGLLEENIVQTTGRVARVLANGGPNVFLNNGLGFVDNITVIDSVSGNETTLNLNPNTSPYLTGCAGTVTPAQLTPDLTNPNIFANALEVQLQNAFCSVFGVSAVNGDAYTLEVSLNNSGLLNIRMYWKHNPTGNYIAIGLNQTNTGQISIDGTTLVNLATANLVNWAGLNCTYLTDCGQIREFSTPFSPIDILNSNIDNLVLRDPSTYILNVNTNLSTQSIACGQCLSGTGEACLFVNCDGTSEWRDLMTPDIVNNLPYTIISKDSIIPCFEDCQEPPRSLTSVGCSTIGTAEVNQGDSILTNYLIDCNNIIIQVVQYNLTNGNGQLSELVSVDDCDIELQERCIIDTNGVTWTEIIQLENGEPVNYIYVDQSDLSLGIPAGLPREWRRCGDDCGSFTGNCMCYGEEDDDTVLVWEYENDDNTTDISFSNNTTTLKWAIEVGQESDADNTGTWAAECIADGRIAEFTITDVNGNTVIFNADTTIQNGGTGGGWAFSGWADASFSGKIQRATIRCKLTDQSGGKACQWLSCDKTEERWYDGTYILTEEEVLTLRECTIPVTVEPECETTLIQTQGCATENIAGQASIGDLILTIGKSDCNGVIVESIQYNITTGNTVLTEPVLTSDCSPDPDVTQTEECIKDALGVEWTEITIVQGTTTTVLYINKISLDIGTPAGDPAKWASCSDECIQWSWQYGCTLNHPDYPDGTKVKWAEGFNCEGDLVINDQVYLCNESETLIDVIEGCTVFGEGGVYYGSDNSGIDVASFESDGTNIHIEGINTLPSWLITNQLDTLVNITTSTQIYRIDGWKDGVEVFSVWIDSLANTNLISYDKDNNPHPIDIYYETLATSNCDALNIARSDSPDIIPTGTILVDKIGVRSRQVNGTLATEDINITHPIQTGFEGINCNCQEVLNNCTEWKIREGETCQDENYPDGTKVQWIEGVDCEGNVVYPTGEIVYEPWGSTTITGETQPPVTTLNGFGLVEGLATATHTTNSNFTSSFVTGLPNQRTWVNMQAGNVIEGTFTNAWSAGSGNELVFETQWSVGQIYDVELLLSDNTYTSPVTLNFGAEIGTQFNTYQFSSGGTGSGTGRHFVESMSFSDFGLSTEQVIGIRITLVNTNDPDFAGVYITDQALLSQSTSFDEQPTQVVPLGCCKECEITSREIISCAAEDTAETNIGDVILTILEEDCNGNPISGKQYNVTNNNTELTVSVFTEECPDSYQTVTLRSCVQDEEETQWTQVAVVDSLGNTITQVFYDLNNQVGTPVGELGECKSETCNQVQIICYCVQSQGSIKTVKSISKTVETTLLKSKELSSAEAAPGKVLPVCEERRYDCQGNYLYSTYKYQGKIISQVTYEKLGLKEVKCDSLPVTYSPGPVTCATVDVDGNIIVLNCTVFTNDTDPTDSFTSYTLAADYTLLGLGSIGDKYTPDSTLVVIECAPGSIIETEQCYEAINSVKGVVNAGEQIKVIEVTNTIAGTTIYTIIHVPSQSEIYNGTDPLADLGIDLSDTGQWAPVDCGEPLPESCAKVEICCSTSELVTVTGNYDKGTIPANGSTAITIPSTDLARNITVSLEDTTCFEIDVTMANGDTYKHATFGGTIAKEHQKCESYITSITITELDGNASRYIVNWQSYNINLND